MECTTIEQARTVFEVNVLGTMRMAQAVVPTMRAQGGGFILNVGSDVGLHANFYQSVYAASKFAVHGLSQVMRWELQTFGIRVAVLDPGWYATEFGESIVSDLRVPWRVRRLSGTGRRLECGRRPRRRRQRGSRGGRPPGRSTSSISPRRGSSTLWAGTRCAWPA